MPGLPRGDDASRRSFQLSAIDPWFLRNIRELVLRGDRRCGVRGGWTDPGRARSARRRRTGFSDRCWRCLLGHDRGARCGRTGTRAGIRPVYKRVDTCAAEFEAYTPYLYSTYEEEDEAPPTDRKKVLILGSGPIRIGQGIEFDYCCVHAALRPARGRVRDGDGELQPGDGVHRLRHLGPALLRAAHHRGRAGDRPRGRSRSGAIVQFGGQTPLRLSVALEKAGLPILGTTPDAIDRAEDRERFARLIEKLGLQAAGERRRPVARGGVHGSRERIGYPVMVRPSYVLGGRAMEVVYDAREPRAVHARGGEARRPSTRC